MEKINKVGGVAARLIVGLVFPVVGLTANIIQGVGDLVTGDKKPQPAKQIVIPKMASGGIVTGPTLAMIGEAGPEAVIPLNGRNAGMGGAVTINISGGISSAADIGRSVVDALTQYTQVYGPLDLAIR